MKKRLYYNYAINSIYQVSLLLIPLFVTPFVTRTIGANGIGQYGYTRSVVSYFILFGTLGTNMYAQREIAYVNDDKQKRSIIFWEIFFIRSFLLVLSLLIYCFTVPDLGNYAQLFWIQTLDIVAAILDITWYFQGLENFQIVVFRNFLIKILSVIFIFLLIKDSDDLNLYVLIYALGNVIGQLWLWKDILKSICGIPFKSMNFYRHLRGIMQLFIPQAAIQIYLVIDKTMIEMISGQSSETGFYELAQTIQRACVTLTTAFGSVAASRVATLKGHDDILEIRRMINQSYEIVCFFGIPLAIGLGGISHNLIPWFMGSNYEKVSGLLICLCPLIVIIGFSNISGIQYLVPMNMQNKVTISTIAGVFINVILNGILIRQYGGYGAAIASVAAECIVLLIQSIYVHEVLQFSEFVSFFFKAMFSSGIMLGILKLTEWLFLSTSSFLHTIMLVIEGIFVYLTMQLLLKNQLILHFLRKVKRRKDIWID